MLLTRSLRFVFAEAYVNLGAALISVGRGTEAAAVLRAGASLDGSGLKDKRAHEAARVQALLQLGALYADQGRLQRALSAYREALHALPDHYPPQVSFLPLSLHYATKVRNNLMYEGIVNTSSVNKCFRVVACFRLASSDLCSTPFPSPSSLISVSPFWENSALMSINCSYSLNLNTAFNSANIYNSCALDFT